MKACPSNLEMSCSREKSIGLIPPNLVNYSPGIVSGRKPKLLSDLETNHDMKVSRTFKDYYSLLNKKITVFTQTTP